MHLNSPDIYKIFMLKMCIKIKVLIFPENKKNWTKLKLLQKVFTPVLLHWWRMLPRSRKSKGDNTKNHACRDKETQGE
jgi:hypothetical protein